MKNKGCLIAFFLTAAVAAFLGFIIKSGLAPLNLANEDPGQVFESFVCSPPPHSVREIRASGVIAFAGGHAFIDFQFDSRDHDDLIQRGRFRLAADTAPIQSLRPEGVPADIVSYVRVNEGMAETTLFVAKDRRRAWFNEVQF
jgi:hypothetical protein